MAGGFLLDSTHRLPKNPQPVTKYRLKKNSSVWLVAILAACQVMTCFEAPAQNFFLGVRASTSNAIPVNSSLTYTLGVTNLASFVVANVFVTNSLPATVQIIGNTTSQGTVSTNGSKLIFSIAAIAIGSNVVMTVTARPTVAGFFTNTVSVFSQQPTNVITTSLVGQATNPIVQVDLGVSMTGPAQPVFTGDWTTYGIIVTNLGSSTVTNIILTNTLPAGVKLIGASPASQAFTLTSNTMTFPLASLTNHGFQNLSVRVQLPTNAGAALFFASVGATGTKDANAVNNVASTNVMVANFFPASLLAVTNSTQLTNRLNGLIEQKILVSNNGTSAVDSVRVIVTGLTNVPLAGFTNYLFNATGTNNGNPYVTYAATLANNNSVELLLQFSVRTRSHFPFVNSQLHAFAVSPPDLTPPPGASTSTKLHFGRTALLSSGEMFLEVSNSIVGRTYTIVYSDNVLFSNAQMAVPPIVAPANFLQWIDYGPPATVNKPGSGPRFYRVFENP